MNSIQELKSIDNDNSSGLVCDIDTEVCGPITKMEGGKRMKITIWSDLDGEMMFLNNRVAFL